MVKKNRDFRAIRRDQLLRYLKATFNQEHREMKIQHESGEWFQASRCLSRMTALQDVIERVEAMHIIWLER